MTYRRGSEFYDDVRIDGKPVGAGGTEISGAWSDGEFAPILAGIFVPSSKTEFGYEKEQKLHSIPAVVFNYHVKAHYNSLYVLKSGKYIWFPEYHGKIWLDAKTFRLLRLERETALMPRNPIRRMETQIDYSDVPLGDGTKFVLPTHSDVFICTPLPPYFDDPNWRRQTSSPTLRRKIFVAGGGSRQLNVCYAFLSRWTDSALSFGIGALILWSSFGALSS